MRSSNRFPQTSSSGTQRAETPISNSLKAYNRNGGNRTGSPYLRIKTPLPQEPAPSPAMNVESTIETSAVVTPNWAIARRSQTSSYSTLQRPERKKKRKNQVIRPPSLSGIGHGDVNRNSESAGIVPRTAGPGAVNRLSNSARLGRTVQSPPGESPSAETAEVKSRDVCWSSTVAHYG